MANEAEEFWKHYHRCAFSVELKSGAKRPFVMQDRKRVLDENTGAAEISFSGSLLTRNLSEKTTNYSYEYLSREAKALVPKTGFINVRSPTRRNSDEFIFMAVWAGFAPSRQYRKGVTPSEVVVTPLFGGYTKASEMFNLNSLVMSDLKPAFKAYLIGLAVEEANHGWFEALDLLTAGRAVSSAISRFFALGTIKGVRHPVLYYKNSIGGIVLDDEVRVTSQVYAHKDFFWKRFGVNLSLVEN